MFLVQVFSRTDGSIVQIYLTNSLATIESKIRDYQSRELNIQWIDISE